MSLIDFSAVSRMDTSDMQRRITKLATQELPIKHPLRLGKPRASSRITLNHIAVK